MKLQKGGSILDNQAFRTTLIILIIVVGLMFAYYIFVAKKSKVIDRFDTNTPTDPNAPKVRIMLFHASWCPHCVSYLKKDGAGQNVFDDKLPAALLNSQGVTFEKYDFDENKALAQQYNITSFPTIIAVDANNQVTKFNGDRNNVSDLVNFVNAQLNK